MKLKAGVALTELVVVLGMVTILLALTTVNLIRLQRRPSLTGSVDTLITDLRHQQSRAMVGAGAASAYGIFFEGGRYILFAGATYNPSEPTNSPVDLPTRLTLTTTLTSSQAVFSTGSGELVGSTFPVTVTVTDQDSGEAQILELNRWGVVTRLD